VRGEVFLELRNPEPPPRKGLSLTMVRHVATIYVIRLPSHPTKGYVLGQMISTSAPGVTSALKSNEGTPWRIDAP
jgi:hypothetical protein